jgi:hypothetical protein
VDQEEPLPRSRDSWEAAANQLYEELLVPLGLEAERLTRIPYLSHGDDRRPLYVLDDALFLCTPTLG